jgi:hypothetical protein
MAKQKRKRIVMSEFDKDYLSNLDSYIESLSIDNKLYYLHKLVSTEGKKSVVWRVKDSTIITTF